ncbi:MAG TPA: chemotaxis protein CheB [Puia sp.]|jgi:two-component system chemotaxis response regulator CheB|nr:chemotaxis protein CheB [Puia sp.]
MQDRLLVIGGSAGSLQVVISILKGMGKDYPWPVLIVLHRTNSFESSLEELLSSRSHLSIKEVEEKEPLVPGRVYVCPADYHVLLEQDHTTSLDYSERVNFSRPSIDVTFRSAADVYGQALIALLLSGGNADGSDGMAYVREKGGMILLQDPQTAEVPYMPQQVLLRMTVDVIASAGELPSLVRGLPYR